MYLYLVQFCYGIVVVHIHVAKFCLLECVARYLDVLARQLLQHAIWLILNAPYIQCTLNYAQHSMNSASDSPKLAIV